jgi:hypothetical protein
MAIEVYQCLASYGDTILSTSLIFGVRHLGLEPRRPDPAVAMGISAGEDLVRFHSTKGIANRIDPSLLLHFMHESTVRLWDAAGCLGSPARNLPT